MRELFEDIWVMFKAYLLGWSSKGVADWLRKNPEDGVTDLSDFLPTPEALDDGFRWVLSVQGMRAVIEIAQSETDVETALVTILANSNLHDIEALDPDDLEE